MAQRKYNYTRTGKTNSYAVSQPKRGRGRLKGSTNKNKSIVKNVVKMELNRAIETKKAYVEPTSANFNTQGSNSFTILPNITQTNFYQIMPTISLGSDSQSRLGNTITPKGLYVKGHFSGDWNNVVGNNSSFQTMYVRILCLSDKQNPVDSIAWSGFSSSYNNLLQKGNTSTNFSFSDQTCLYRPVNTDRFTVHYDKVIKIGNYSASLGTANVDQIAGLKRFKFKVPLKQKMKFDDTNTRPTNCNMPFLLIGYCPGDNRNITGGATTSFLRCSYYSDFYYKDA